MSIDDPFLCDLINLLVKYKLIGENNLRDIELRKEYLQLQKEGMKCMEARELLAEKYFVGLKNLERIVYTKEKKMVILVAEKPLVFFTPN